MYNKILYWLTRTTLQILPHVFTGALMSMVLDVPFFTMLMLLFSIEIWLDLRRLFDPEFWFRKPKQN